MRSVHPFVVDVRRARFGSAGFTWSIKERGDVKLRSHDFHVTFEEARIALQVALTRCIAEWKATQ